MNNVALDSKPFLSPEVRIVEASAGSGKTYALAKRYVQLVLNPHFELEQIPIRNILALTFTNKAAFEMKARIFEFLKKIALKQLSEFQEDDILKPLGLNRDQASQKAFAVMEGVIRHYNFFQVQTIDKFIKALLSGCSFKIGLTANFKIKTNPREYLQYSLDQLIDRASHDPEVLSDFKNFLHQYLYLENRSNWFPKNDILEIITKLFEQHNTYGRDFNEGPFAYGDAIKKKRSVLEEVHKLRGLFPAKTNAGFIKSVDKFLERHTRGFDIDHVSDYFRHKEFPVNKGGIISDEVAGSWKKIKRLLKQACHSESQSIFNPYIRIYTMAIEGFARQAQKDDCLFLNELNKKAGGLFDEDHITVAELYYRLATRFCHYLIDEFQDTSRLQWNNLERMTEEALSTGGTLFYVGDRKQAIYSFRGGDAGLFDDIAKEFQAFNVNTDVLSNNWRSQKAIVEFNNAIFARENLRNFIRQKAAYEAEKNVKNTVAFHGHDMATMDHVFGKAQQAYKKEHNGGYVRMEYIDGDIKEDRDRVLREKLLHLIKDLKKRFSYSDIAVLTRGNKEIKAITGWFLEEGVPVESEYTSDITENRLIIELVAFLQFLNSPIDNEAFATFILGDLFARASGFKKEETHAFIFSLRPRLIDEKNFYIYTELRKKYPDVWKSLIEEFFLNVGLCPLYELVITIYQRFSVFNFGQTQGFFMHFLELIKNNEEEHAEIQSFLEYFEQLKGEDLYVNVAGSDAVKIMTIHKAKGLEFPVVIVPYVGIEVKIGTRSGEYQPSYVLKDTDEGISLLRLKSEYRKFSEDLNLLYETEYKKIFFSELNKIYVALTRPKYELYGFIPKRTANSFNMARFLIPQEYYERGVRADYQTEQADDAITRDIPPSVYSDWIDYLKDEFQQLSEIKNRKSRLQGEVMHFILARIGDLGCVDDQQGVIDCAVGAARCQYPDVEDWPFFKDRLNKLIGAEALKPYFYCDQAQVFTEREIVDVHGRTKRCDRLIVFGSEVWIVDFKSTKDVEDRDRQQIQEYKEILKGIYPKKMIKGFLIYLDRLEAEEI